MSKAKIYWILQTGGWSLFAAINIILAYLEENLTVYYLIYAVLVLAWFIISTHIFRYFILKWGWLEVKIKKIILKVFFCIFVLTISNFLTHLLFLVSLGILLSGDLDLSTIGATLVTTFFIYFIWTLFYFIYHYIERYNTALKYEALKNEIELNNLKSQLNPHFIFNALNSIRALVDENPSKSKDAITQLSSLLRSSLVINRNKLTRFTDELNAVKDYLELESIRFEERLRTKFDIDPESKKFTVPPLMIQTIVENGIKHGISKLQKGGEISLQTKVRNSTLFIKIRNNGQLPHQKLNGSKGFGIENTKQRLKLLYGNKATFKICNEDDNTVLTELSLPQTV
ncbi:MAG: histidine kinase [Cytophagales bacterium]|nr:histidine kinase [Cytophagales bacterium]